MKKCKYIAGVDEAGRGPLAGPVAVGVAVVPTGFTWNLIPGVGDSKKITEKNREAIFLRAQELKKLGMLNYSVSLVSVKVIDSKGIIHAVSQGISHSLKKLDLNPNEVLVKLDGLLHAPREYKYQETIIKGDEKERVIGLASILAKVTRDRYMMRKDAQFPQYGFSIHKGYGTLMHRDAIKKFGTSDMHRKMFCRKLKTR